MGEVIPARVWASGACRRARVRGCVLLAAVLCQAVWAVSAKAVPVQFVIDVQDAAGVGFNDPTFGADALNALQTAADIWGGLLQASHAGETITIGAKFENLPGTAAIGTSNLPLPGHYIESIDPFTVLPSALANHRSGGDIDAATNEFEIKVDPSPSWHFLTDGMPGANLDFLSIALHEIGHGLGILSGMNNSDGSLDFTVQNAAGAMFDTGYLYDRGVQLGGGGAFLLNQSPVDRAASLISGNVFWVGTNGVAANGGTPPQLFAPNPFNVSSIDHLDPSHGQGELMVPNRNSGEVVHAPSAVDIGILEDLGWNFVNDAAAVPEPVSMGLCLTGLAAAGWGAGRRRRA